MSNINGRNFSESNTTSTNVRVVSEYETAKTKRFDEKKSEDAKNVDKIAIDSTFADVNISVSDSSKVEVHFYGQADTDGDVNFDVCMVKNEFRITLKFAENSYNSNLKLDVTVPHKKFKVISAKSVSANITVGEEVSTKQLKVNIKHVDSGIKYNINKIFQYYYEWRG